ncbi:hypothetical protein MLD38_008734 [Melastoma candidum]|uniref:Uncharacterized protein n=1 Tax=Melastoma candidum TaxID=119954 RepID=A0ACB9S3U1_9MYRT|nr:hypothetical protein MLD38_008734 [Melastoma candidum]
MMAAAGLDPIPLTPQKVDPAWKHCLMYKDGTKILLKCIYCNKVFKGGGIHRIKEHLACYKGNAAVCPRVPPDVRKLMHQSLEGVVGKRKRKEKIDEAINSMSQPSGEVDVFAGQGDTNTTLVSVEVPIEQESIEFHSNGDVNREGSRLSKSGIRRKRANAPGNMNGDIIVALKREGDCAQAADSAVHVAIAQFLYDIGAPLSSVNSAYFQPMLDAVASSGGCVMGPTFHDLKGPVLRSVSDEAKSNTIEHSASWARTGCSLLVEQVNTEMGRTFLCFFVNSSQGTIFLKFVDASASIHSVDMLVEDLRQAVEEAGVNNVLQVITSNEEQYAAAGRRLMEIVPTVYWSPCARQSIDLILGDFLNIELISAVVEQAKSITRFIYNHVVVLNILRRYTYGNDIIEIGDTMSASNFTTLKRMVDLKHNLQAMVTSQEWVDCPHSKKPEGLEVLDCINNESFWSSCVLINRLVNPLLRLLKVVGSEKRPAMGYVYAGMYKAKEVIKKELIKEEYYMTYWKIIDQRWESHWSLPLHAAGFYLNPKFFYSIEGDLHSEMVSGMFDCIERLVVDTKVQDTLIKELTTYKSAAGDLGRKMAIRARDTIFPPEWWSTYGGVCPNLTRLATRILSQTCSALRFKHNPALFDQIQELQNRLERQRLIDLVYVQYNLQLRQPLMNMEQDIIDPISVEMRSLVEDWVSGKNIHLEDTENWMALEPPPSSTSLLFTPQGDEIDDLGSGFDDLEILNRAKTWEDNSNRVEIKCDDLIEPDSKELTVGLDS